MGYVNKAMFVPADDMNVSSESQIQLHSFKNKKKSLIQLRVQLQSLAIFSIFRSNANLSLHSNEK